MKIAMIRVYRSLLAEGLKSRILLQVHDELIVEAPEEKAEIAALILKEEMENAYKLDVSLIAEEKHGKSWYETK